MPVRFRGNTAYLRGTCTVEDGEPLLAWCLEREAPRVNLKECRHLHTAVLQVLLVAEARLATPPEDAQLREIIAPLLRS
jgi:hypothetical protein